VTGRDRPGLLHDLARVLSRHGLSIDHAIAATRGAVVTDTFYVLTQNGDRPGREDHPEMIRELLAVVESDPDES
jgi:[protein-PII] uridylyltransferase